MSSETTETPAAEPGAWSKVLNAITDGFARLESRMIPEPPVEDAPVETTPAEAPSVNSDDEATIALQKEVASLREATSKLQAERDALKKAQDDARNDEVFRKTIQDSLADSPIAPGAESDVEARVRAHGFIVDDGVVSHPSGETIENYISQLRKTEATHLFHPPVGAPTDRNALASPRGATSSILKNPSDAEWHKNAAKIASGEVVVQWDNDAPTVIH